MVDSAGGARPLRGQPRTPEQIEKQFKDVSQLYEKQFLREMVKAMRSTIQESGFIKQNQGEKIFREQLDQEYVEKWGSRGGIGIADMIYNQLVEKYGEAAGLKQRVEKVKGPISVAHLSDFQVNQKVSSEKYPITYEFERNVTESSNALGGASSSPAESRGLVKIQNPLMGRLLQNIKLGPDETVLEILHDSGLKSRMVFRGQSPSLVQGQRLDQGQTIGLLSPEARSFFWSVALDQKSVSE